MRQRILRASVILLFCTLKSAVSGQGDELIHPQLWNNVFLGWNASDRFAIRNAFAYNALLYPEKPWSEMTISSTAAFKLHDHIEGSAGMYYARANQSESLKTHEVRPFIGIRLTTNPEKRWLISNLSRLELRRFIYSDNDNSTSFRFRNRSDLAFALNRVSMSAERNLFLFGYFEAFLNFGEEVRERFFNQYKYKLGLGYRPTSNWNVNLGVIYQDAENNVLDPVQLPSNVITNFVIEWGVAFIIGSKSRD